MNCLFAIALVALAMPALVHGGRHDRAKQACLAKYPDSLGEIVIFASSGTTTSNEFKCYTSCILQAIRIMDSNGTISVPSNPTKPIRSEQQPCFSMPPASDVCESAYELLKCMLERHPSRDFLRAFTPRGAATPPPPLPPPA